MYLDALQFWDTQFLYLSHCRPATSHLWHWSVNSTLAAPEGLSNTFLFLSQWSLHFFCYWYCENTLLMFIKNFIFFLKGSGN